VQVAWAVKNQTLTHPPTPLSHYCPLLLVYNYTGQIQLTTLEPLLLALLYCSIENVQPPTSQWTEQHEEEKERPKTMATFYKQEDPPGFPTPQLALWQ